MQLGGGGGGGGAGSTPRREMFSITPNGYYFRSRLHKRLDGVANEFKKQPRAPDRRVGAAEGRELGYAPPAAPPRVRRRRRSRRPPLRPPACLMYPSPLLHVLLPVTSAGWAACCSPGSCFQGSGQAARATLVGVNIPRSPLHPQPPFSPLSWPHTHAQLIAIVRLAVCFLQRGTLPPPTAMPLVRPLLLRPALASSATGFGVGLATKHVP